MIITIFVFTLFGTPGIWWRIGSRVDRDPDHRRHRLRGAPAGGAVPRFAGDAGPDGDRGSGCRRSPRRSPTTAQIEVAVASFDEVLRREAEGADTLELSFATGERTSEVVASGPRGPRRCWTDRPDVPREVSIHADQRPRSSVAAQRRTDPPTRVRHDPPRLRPRPGARLPGRRSPRRSRPSSRTCKRCPPASWSRVGAVLGRPDAAPLPRSIRTSASRSASPGCWPPPTSEASRIVDEAKTEADRMLTKPDRRRSDPHRRPGARRGGPQEADELSSRARQEADRVLTGLSVRREAMVEQLHDDADPVS